ncbi:MAG TPA: aconitase family protein [Candidatus Saccharimonadales bacterium]|nr:aconitase family protein [Candidatus Saccharimonadales bacterium]
MIESLLKRPVRKRPEKIRLQGRVLYLVDDAKMMERQLAGEDLPWRRDLPLRDEISTDEITPAYICYHYDEKLGDYPYLGFRAGQAFPVKEGLVRAGGFVASVSGKRRGKGSSREASPFAELNAGIRLVVAESIERIYRQNCQNLGLLTSTDFGIVERVLKGEEIPLEEFTRGEDEITRQVIEYGGLFAYNVARMQGKATVPAIDTPPRPMTLAEKILAAHMVADPATGRTGVPAVKPGDTGFVMCDLRFSHEYVTPMAAAFFAQQVGAGEKVTDPSSIVMFRDHLTFLAKVMPEERKRAGLLALADQLVVRQEEFAREQGIRLHGEVPGGGSEGICHSMILQDYALPGQVIIGTDSHTPHSGAMGCIAFGVGTTDIFNSWITKDVRVRVPQTVRIEVSGKRPANVTAKDFMLAILAHPYVRGGEALAKVIEYGGPAVSALNVDERATMTNMAAEVGGFTGIIAPDARTADYLVATRGMNRAEAERLCEAWQSDEDAEYAKVIRIDASSMKPMVATPGDPGNGVAIDTLGENVKVDIAYAGSCTAAKKEDMDMYAAVLSEAVARSGKVHPDVQMYIQFGSQEVKRYCQARGYIDTFVKAGANVIDPSCGACINSGPGASTRKDQVTISAQNRNFPGRSGPGQVYLASPFTVAASAVAGRIVAWEPEPAKVG